MKNKFFIGFFLTFILLQLNFSPSGISALSSIPQMTGAVNDYANVLSPQGKQSLSEYLNVLNDKTGIQIAVLTVQSINGDSIEDFAIQVAQTWGVGQKKEDNGVLFVVSMAERKIRIEVGYGLEGTLTDEKCGLIIRNVVVPNFQNGKYEEGIVLGVQNIINFVAPDSELATEEVVEADTGTPLFEIIILIAFACIYIFLFTGAIGAKFPSMRWIPWARFFHPSQTTPYSGSTSYTSGGSMGGSSSFSGGFGSSGHGGGGGFGGGGASGGW